MHGGPFHSQNPEMYFVHTPGLKVVCPATAYDAKGLMKAAIRDPDPVIFFEHKFLYRRIKEELPEEDFTVPIGKAVVRRSGSDVSVITYGAMVFLALDAAKELEKEGIDLEVVDLRSLLPYDRETVLESVKRTNKVILLHEDVRTGGFAGELAAVIAERSLRPPRRAYPSYYRAGHACALQSAPGRILLTESIRRGPRRERIERLLADRADRQDNPRIRCHVRHQSDHAPDGREHF